MKVQAVSFCGDISKGRKKFEKLPLIKQLELKAIEKSRQEFNKTHFPNIPAKNTDLAEYVRHIVFVEQVVKASMKDVFAKLKKNIGI